MTCTVPNTRLDQLVAERFNVRNKAIKDCNKIHTYIVDDIAIIYNNSDKKTTNSEFTVMIEVKLSSYSRTSYWIALNIISHNTY